MEINKEFWDNRWENKTTGWDIGSPSTPLKDYIDQLEDKSIKILIPGCGNAYEGEYLFKQGFTNVYLMDISPLALEEFQKRFPDFPSEHLICADFFEHDEQFDLILEQTFFCAIDPKLRDDYVSHCHSILNPGGKVVGLLWEDDMFEDHPPFGGHKPEYVERFSSYFEIKTMEMAHNSIAPRAGRELFFIAIKK